MNMIAPAIPTMKCVVRIKTYVDFALQDYEYGGYNPIAYDFANHFCEMTANYHTDTPHIMHFNTYPGK